MPKSPSKTELEAQYEECAQARAELELAIEELRAEMRSPLHRAIARVLTASDTAVRFARTLRYEVRLFTFPRFVFTHLVTAALVSVVTLVVTAQAC